jgi:hypothetical protein
VVQELVIKFLSEGGSVEGMHPESNARDAIIMSM